MRALLATAFLAVAGPAVADQTVGTVATFDRARNVLILKDRTVWTLPAETIVPADVTPGTAVRIVYVSNADNGWGKIVRIERVAG
jgi:hypothetical protein